MIHLPFEIYTWTILTVLDSAEMPFLEARYFQTGATRMGMLSGRELKSFAEIYLRSNSVFEIRPDDDPLTKTGSFRWDQSYTRALRHLNKHDCVATEEASNGEIISITGAGRKLVSAYELHTDVTKLHVYLFEKSPHAGDDDHIPIDPIVCPTPLMPFEIPNLLVEKVRSSE